MHNLAPPLFSTKRTAAFALLLLTCFSARGTTVLAFETEAELIEILTDDGANDFQKSVAFRHLAIVGTERSVPLLAKMLSDPELSHLARRALEPISSPAVDAAFAEALPKLNGTRLVGLISSIGNRGEVKAIPAMSHLLSDKDPIVVQAAANCLARLGTVASADALRNASTTEFAGPLLTLSKKLAAQGHGAKAIELLTRISEGTAFPAQARNAAKQRLIVLQKAKGLQKSLTSTDPRVFNLGLRAARLLPSAKSTKVVLGVIPKAPVDRLPRLITLLGDLGERSSREVIIDAASSSSTEVRVAALGALHQLGTAKQVPLLLDSAAEADSMVASAAQQTLTQLNAEGVDLALLDLLKSEGDQLSVVIRTIGKRQIFDAAPQLLEMTEGGHQLEVIAALGEILTLDQLGTLGEFLKSDSEELREAAIRAIHSACIRMPDRTATVAFLASYLADAPEARIAFVYDELRRISGAEALRVVTEAAKGDDPLHKDYATRALGKWGDASAADVLLAIAKAEGGSKYGIRCLRGYVRLARQFPSIPWDVRLKMCQEVLQTAVRKNEKILIFEVLLRYGYSGELRFSIKARDEYPEIAQEAEECAHAIAKKMGVKRKDVRDILTQAGIIVPEEGE